MDTDAPTLNPVAYLDMLPVIKVNSCRPLGYRVKGVQVLFQEPKFQAYVNKEALHLSCEFLRLFTVEALHRASEEQDRIESSMSDETGTASRKALQVEHLERILPQLLLDF